MRFWLLLGGVIFLCGCRSTLPEGMARIVLESPHGERVPLIVEIADDPGERARGLMGRTEVPEGTGMLFLFDHEERLSFWMKNTLVPLDIFFFTRSGEFVSRATMQPCSPEPVALRQAQSAPSLSRGEGCRGYPSAGPAAFALEVGAGFAEDRGVGEGWKLSIE